MTTLNTKTQYIYKDVEFDMSKTELITLLNEYGKDGWRFHSMAQKVSNVKDFRTGQMKMAIFIILEKQFYKVTNNEA